MNVVCYLVAGAVLSAVAGCDVSAPADKAETKDTQVAKIHPEIWPKQASPFKRNDSEERRITALIEQMSLEEKVGQVIQADIGSVTPDEVREYHLGSVLNGGNSAPGGDNRTTPAAWVALADEFWLASTDKKMAEQLFPHSGEQMLCMATTISSVRHSFPTISV